MGVFMNFHLLNLSLFSNCQFGQDWSFSVVVLDLPKYMNDVLHFSIEENGIYTSLPQLLKLFVSLGTGAWSDWLIANDYLSITNARKIFIAICM